jgi:hypothetical protein
MDYGTLGILRGLLGNFGFGWAGPDGAGHKVFFIPGLS